jgi:hypothetical protein
MPGGVGGVASRDVPLSRSINRALRPRSLNQCCSRTTRKTFFSKLIEQFVDVDCRPGQDAVVTLPSPEAAFELSALFWPCKGTASRILRLSSGCSSHSDVFPRTRRVRCHSRARQRVIDERSAGRELVIDLRLRRVASDLEATEAWLAPKQ